jgi:hypothetical protein
LAQGSVRFYSNYKKKAYFLYFGCKVGDQDKEIWVNPIIIGFTQSIASTSPRLLPSLNPDYYLHCAQIIAFTSPRLLPSLHPDYCHHLTQINAFTSPRLLPSLHPDYCLHFTQSQRLLLLQRPYTVTGFLFLFRAAP